MCEEWGMVEVSSDISPRTVGGLSLPENKYRLFNCVRVFIQDNCTKLAVCESVER